MIPVIVGAIGGFAAARLIGRFRHHHGGCARGGRGFGGPRRLFWMARSLGLDRHQREALWSIASRVRQSVGALRFGGLRGLDVIADVLSADAFDRARLDQLATEQGDAFAAARKEIVDGLEKIHAILTPEQRRRLRELLGAGPGGPEGGPYRV
jgi:Spy/CpxP family protein refolding chaperone